MLGRALFAVGKIASLFGLLKGDTGAGLVIKMVTLFNIYENAEDCPIAKPAVFRDANRDRF
jgi:hypothetical protein